MSETTHKPSTAFQWYFIAVSFVTLLALMFSVEGLIKVGMEDLAGVGSISYSSGTICDQNNEHYSAVSCESARQRESEASRRVIADGLAGLIVSVPIFAIHFFMVCRNWKKRNTNE